MTNSPVPIPFVLSDRIYGILKWVIAIVLPAFGALYFALAQTWGLPDAEQVLGTIVAVQTFLGVILGLSSIQYKNSDARYSGQLNITQTDDKKLYSLEMNHEPEKLDAKKEAVFKVNGPK